MKQQTKDHFLLEISTLDIQGNKCIYTENKVNVLNSTNVSSIILVGMFLPEMSLVRAKGIMSGHANTPNLPSALLF